MGATITKIVLCNGSELRVCGTSNELLFSSVNIFHLSKVSAYDAPHFARLRKAHHVCRLGNFCQLVVGFLNAQTHELI